MPRLSRISLPVALLLFAVFHVQAQTLAPTPPMGWNSWDAYGMSINEADFKANVTVLAGMKQLGWQYAVVDEGWYLEEPLASGTEAQKFVYDANGRLIPALNRFPDAANGAGLKPLADWVHAQGLKFGIHLIRGIPRQSVKGDKPIAGSSFKASDAADTTDLCPWNSDNYGIKDNAAGQAWYDAMIGLYATWGIDYLKVDCISDRPYKISEIKQVAAAIKKTGRPIVLSLSPGPTNLSHAEEVAKYAQLWRISDDHWDVWSHIPEPGKGEFPMGTLQAFDRLAAWSKYTKPGSWPDEDMLPLGYLGPHPGWQKPRESRLTHDEEQTEFTLWAISRSPLILGGNLTKLDDFTKSLITNKELVYINQFGRANRPTLTSKLPASFEHVKVWQSEIWGGWGDDHSIVTDPPQHDMYFAFFNLNDKPVALHATWEQLGLTGSGYKLRDGNHFLNAKGVELSLPAHGSAIKQLRFPMDGTPPMPTQATPITQMIPTQSLQCLTCNFTVQQSTRTPN